MTRFVVPVLLVFASSLAHAYLPTSTTTRARFAIPRSSSTTSSSTTTTTTTVNAMDEDPIECYIVNNEAVVEEGEKPEVVCTSKPDEYAWFNGLEPEKMKPTDGVIEGSMECVEGASPRGNPEWECK